MTSDSPFPTCQGGDLGGREFVLFLTLLLICRFALSAWLPIMDFTEARYAEIARNIAARGDWVTLWFLADQPFWGKPPLAFWSVASTYLLGGVSEFTTRLSSTVYTAATAGLIWHFGNHLYQRGRVAVIIYLSTLLTIHTSGSILTDPAMVFGTTLTMVAFWHAIRTGNALWGYLVWIGLAIGALAKGPVALVLCGFAAGIWVVAGSHWRDFFGRFFGHGRWVTGPMLLVVLVGPWYWLAEQATPGFLDYFIVGEHWQRFVVSNWEGDLYGSVKDRPIGTVWIFLAVAFMPWTLFVVAWVRSNAKLLQRLLLSKNDGDLLRYLLLWAIVPAVFFTPARNIIVTYVMPAIPALSLLVTAFASTTPQMHTTLARIASASVLVYTVAVLALYYTYFEDHRYNRKGMAELYLAMNAKDPGHLFVAGKPKFSLLFYTGGNVTFFGYRAKRYDAPRSTHYVATPDRWFDSIVRGLPERCLLVTRGTDLSLFHCPGKGAQGTVDTP